MRRLPHRAQGKHFAKSLSRMRQTAARPVRSGKSFAQFDERISANARGESLALPRSFAGGSGGEHRQLRRRLDAAFESRAAGGKIAAQIEAFYQGRIRKP